jgi:hypothetical protein
MLPRFWIRNVFTRPATHPIRKAPPRTRPCLEALEDRTVPSGITGLTRQIDLATTVFPFTGSAADPRAKPQGFDGINALQSALVNGFNVDPSDEGLAVGNGYVVNAVNAAICVYDKSGKPLTDVVALNSFLGLSSVPWVSDPSVYFDQPTQRWFVDALTLEVDPETGNYTGANHLDLAVSQTADPTGGWNIYRLPVQNDGTQGTPNHGDADYSGPFYGDYPHIGADRNGIYLTTNEYRFSDDDETFRGAQVYAFSKAALEAGAGTLSVVQFDTAVNPAGNADGLAGFTLIPASTPDAAFAGSQGGTEYLLSSTDLSEIGRTTGNLLEVWALTNTKSLDGAHPNLTLQSSAITVDTFSLPPDADQKPGIFPLGLSLGDPDFVHSVFGPDATPTTEVEKHLDSIDTRMTQVTYANGKLWGAIDTAVTVGGATKAGIAWYVINPLVNANGVSGSVVNQGTLALPGNNLIDPVLGVTSSGKGVIGFTVAGRDYYPSAGYATLDAKSGAGAIQIAATGVGPEDGFAGYSFFGDNWPRWGDYGAAAVDGETVWLAAQYIANSGTVAEYQADRHLGGTRASWTNWDNRITPVSTSGGGGIRARGAAASPAGETILNSDINTNQANPTILLLGVGFDWENGAPSPTKHTVTAGQANGTKGKGGDYVRGREGAVRISDVNGDKPHGTVPGKSGGNDSSQGVQTLTPGNVNGNEATTAFDDIFGVR